MFFSLPVGEGRGGAGRFPRQTFCFGTIFLLIHTLHAQTLPAPPRPWLDTLCSERFGGRGYDGGGKRAAQWVARRFAAAGLQPICPPVPEYADVLEHAREDSVSYYQFYPQNVVILEKAELVLGGRTLALGREWLPDAGFPNVHLTSLHAVSQLHIERVPTLVHTIADTFSRRPTIKLLDTTKALTAASMAREKTLPQGKASLKVRSRREAYWGRNVVGLVRGTAVPDSFLIIGAHYDHLGRIGKDVYFPGANDNASGTTLLLELAAYTAAHPLRYSVVFVAFGSEEAGLVGSRAFVKEPPVPLAKVRFMLNLDLMGSGEDGATLVNAPAVQPDYDRLQALNDRLAALPKLRPRRNSPNSDHYGFAQAGVPAMFMFLQGPYRQYHNPDDRPDGLSLAGFEGAFKLCLAFMGSLAGH